MSDLISRSVAIDEIWNVFNSYVNDDSRFDEFETEAINKAFKVLQNRIEKQPTAYNVDAVVAELEKATKYVTIDGKSTGLEALHPIQAIDIVKRGGIE